MLCTVFYKRIIMNQIISQLKPHVEKLLSRGTPVIVAIEGNCTAGKTTLAAALEKEYDCNVFHMDDFFLRPEQRTAERYAQAGGNVDYERFQEEVLDKLKAGKPVAYRPFDCSTFTLSAETVVQPKQLSIVEGTYCLHPYFGDPYDLKIFMDISEDCQTERILKRPEFLHQRFFEVWIPMEKNYFERFQIKQKCDLIFGDNV